MNDNEARYTHYVCPECGGDLDYCEFTSPDIPDSGKNNRLSCKSCRSCFPIVKGIPRFVLVENYSQTFGFQWNIHHDTQLDSKLGLSISKDRFFCVTRWPALMPSIRVLEAGCGAGRFTEIICRTGAEVFSFDYSNAVDANHRNNNQYANLNLFQGDISKIPFPQGHFDKIFCLGVLQHTPNPEVSFHSLIKALKPGGEIAIDVYRKGLSIISWKYLLRIATKRMKAERLYSIVKKIVPILIPVSRFFKKYAGRLGGHLVPIAEYSNLPLSPEQNLDWSILDTFDMYSPVHDHPQTISTVRKWFEEAKLKNIVVQRGPNGVIGRGIKMS